MPIHAAQGVPVHRLAENISVMGNDFDGDGFAVFLYGQAASVFYKGIHSFSAHGHVGQLKNGWNGIFVRQLFVNAEQAVDPSHINVPFCG